MGVVISVRRIEPWGKVEHFMDTGGTGVSEVSGRMWIVTCNA